MSKEKILIIEDEFKMRYLLRTHLSPSFEIEEASDGKEGIYLLKKERFSLIILDIMMEGMDGWEVCKEIRASGNSTPILMLTARSETREKVQGLNLGADDYVVKPFDPDELKARIHALIRRSEKQENEGKQEGIISMNSLTIDFHSRDVFVKDNKVELTVKEFDLILLLVQNPNWAYTREMLLDKVWGETKILDQRTVDSHIKHLRQKLKGSGLHYDPIKTVWGVGYKFNIPNEKNG